ncbi:hypothetical protein J0A68_01695 [Algoriphagus sp. H41]|uniref:YARHG domain-containing protein n=1 Tax=Algoriphagus oliviformis TaxID=2811231 RepID=A0ABS3C0D3_9BACT|nr:hypothetical protein [Algoriphagus oliviformis]MBN7809650.1 hypothetical protein [Algoriphagus oliviformis]
MRPFKGILFFLWFALSTGGAFSQESPPPVKNDSIVLAQAYINLTLTKEFFEGMPEERINRILAFEMEELGSITDPAFLDDNAALYNFSYSLLYYVQAKFFFRTKSEISRDRLLTWKESLEKSIDYFNRSKSRLPDFEQNPFFELIKFEEASYSILHRELFELKSLFTPYFNEDIYPDFKRIFLKAKNSDSFEIDSLAYLAAIFSIEFNSSIVENDYSEYSYDFGPNTLPIPSRYSHAERNYDYSAYENPVGTSYLLDDRLDLISRYVQLKRLASTSHADALSPFQSYRLYNSFHIFRDDIEDRLFLDQLTDDSDAFLAGELDQEELDRVYADLRAKFPYASYATAQAYINLSIIQANFESQSNSQIASVLEFHEKELRESWNSDFAEQNPELSHFTQALLYENLSRLLYRSRKNILRQTLVEWKEALEKGIDHFNLSQTDSGWSEEKRHFHELIQFDSEDIHVLDSRINGLKSAFTPYFNEDIYPDFQRIFYKAKNAGEYDFEGLKRLSELYSIRLDLSVLENRGPEPPNWEFDKITQTYEMLPKLDLVSKFIQFKYLASDQFSIPTGFDVKQLYDSYDDFLFSLGQENDAFVMRELNPEAIEVLFSQLQEKFPFPFSRELVLSESESDGVVDFLENMQAAPVRSALFFPELAPLASASLIKRNFKPELRTLGQVDGFLRSKFLAAGYGQQLHYYYASDGYAMTTSLEKFNLDGSAVAADKRFVKSLAGEQKLSYYEIFKSMFFDLEFDYRMFALVVSSKATVMSRNGMTPQFAENLIANSYDQLPTDLQNKTLSDKTLSVFVYHFHLNLGSGTVELDLSGEISAQEYLRKAGLIGIIQ